MASKMVVFCGSDAPEKAYPPFMLGLGALASDLELMLFFSMSGLNIVTKTGAENIKLEGASMPLPEMIANAQEMGARLVACSAVFPVIGITEEDLLESVEVGGVATFVTEAETADIVLAF